MDWFSFVFFRKYLYRYKLNAPPNVIHCCTMWFMHHHSITPNRKTINRRTYDRSFYWCTLRTVRTLIKTVFYAVVCKILKSAKSQRSIKPINHSRKLRKKVTENHTKSHNWWIDLNLSSFCSKSVGGQSHISIFETDGRFINKRIIDSEKLSQKMKKRNRRKRKFFRIKKWQSKVSSISRAGAMDTYMCL